MVNPILKKLTTRNIIANGTVGVFLYVIYYIIVQNPQLLENSVATMLLGQFTMAVGLVYYFFFRKPQSKESDPKADV